MENQNQNFGQNAAEWQAPPPPPPLSPRPEAEPPRMSEAATLGSIFFEPGETFEDLRRKPRFLLAMLIMIIAITGYTFLFFGKLGEERMQRSVIEQMDKSSASQGASPEMRQQQVSMAMTISNYIKYAMPIFILVGFAVGGLLYWLAGKAMGGDGNFLHGLSAYVYSSFPPTLVLMLGNIIVLFLKSADDIDISASQRGLIHANPSFFIDGKETPVLATLLSTFDLFQIWGWILAAIGLHKLMRISKGAAWAIVLIIALLGLAYRVFSAFTSGNPM